MSSHPYSAYAGANPAPQYSTGTHANYASHPYPGSTTAQYHNHSGYTNSVRKPIPYRYRPASEYVSDLEDGKDLEPRPFARRRRPLTRPTNTWEDYQPIHNDHSIIDRRHSNSEDDSSNYSSEEEAEEQEAKPVSKKKNRKPQSKPSPKKKQSTSSHLNGFQDGFSDALGGYRHYYRKPKSASYRHNYDNGYNVGRASPRADPSGRSASSKNEWKGAAWEVAGTVAEHVGKRVLNEALDQVFS